MITAHTIKILQSLDKKKFRQKYNLFLVEGNKTIKEIPNSTYKIIDIYSLAPEDLEIENVPITKIEMSALKKISFLQHPSDSVAVCELKVNKPMETVGAQIILDGIRDPGNLGTIIRLADWFGINQIVCSEDTADFYNPKVIQASRGSFLRVNVVYQNLQKILKNSVYRNIGTDMIGENVFGFHFPEKFNLILGNEGSGMRQETRQLLTDTITIPRFGNSQSTESLNVAMSTSIILGQIFSKKC